jgi:hypothetical protein
VLFSLIASAIYQVDDLVDLEADCAHPKKRHRPQAARALSIPLVLGAAGVMVVVGAAASWWLLGPMFTFVLGCYLALTTAYTFRLKAAMTFDVIALACLYTIRIVAGAVAIDVPLSFWLLLFSIFFFLSLGYLKRYTELAGAVEPAARPRLRRQRHPDRRDVGHLGGNGVDPGDGAVHQRPDYHPSLCQPRPPVGPLPRPAVLDKSRLDDGAARAGGRRSGGLRDQGSAQPWRGRRYGAHPARRPVHSPSLTSPLGRHRAVIKMTGRAGYL